MTSVKVESNPCNYDLQKNDAFTVVASLPTSTQNNVKHANFVLLYDGSTYWV